MCGFMSFTATVSQQSQHAAVITRCLRLNSSSILFSSRTYKSLHRHTHTFTLTKPTRSVNTKAYTPSVSHIYKYHTLSHKSQTQMKKKKKSNRQQGFSNHRVHGKENQQPGAQLCEIGPDIDLCYHPLSASHLQTKNKKTHLG